MQPGPARPLGPGQQRKPGQRGRPGQQRRPGLLRRLGWPRTPGLLRKRDELRKRGLLRRPGWPRSPGGLRRPGPAPGKPPRPDPAPPRESGWRCRQPPVAPDGWPARRRWPVRPPPRAGSSRRRSSTTPCPPNPDRPGSAGTARRRAIRWDRNRFRLALAAPSRRRGRWLARWVSRTLAAAPEARRTSPSSDGCLADQSPPFRLPGATTAVSGASFMLCQENGPCHAVTASSRRDPSGRSWPG